MKAGSSQMDQPYFEELDGAREEARQLIIDVMTPYHSSFEMSDIPMYLAKYQNSTLFAIADRLRPYSSADTDILAAKMPVRLLRALTGVGRERYVVTALECMDFFCKEAAAKRFNTYAESDEIMDPNGINRAMEDTFKSTEFKINRSYDSLQPGHDYDAKHHACIMKAQRLAHLIKLEEMVNIKVDYYHEIYLISQNIDLIEDALPVILNAAPIVYGKSKTKPDGSGLRPLLNAKAVIEIAEVCAGDPSKQRMVLALIEERGAFDKELLEMVAGAESQPLSVGIL